MRLAALLLLIAPIVASAQTDESPPLWLSVGVGSSTGSDTPFVGIGASVSAPVVSSHDVLTFGASVASEADLFGSNIDYREAHLAYGVMDAGRRGMVSVAAGPAVVLARRFENGRGYVRNARLGAHIGAQGFLRLSPSIGLGGEVFSQISPELSTVGFRLLLVAGRL